MLLLTDLPPEIVCHVIEFIRCARDLSHLSLSCRRMLALVNKDGYRIFLHNTFPTIQIPAPAVRRDPKLPFISFCVPCSNISGVLGDPSLSKTPHRNMLEITVPFSKTLLVRSRRCLEIGTEKLSLPSKYCLSRTFDSEEGPAHLDRLWVSLRSSTVTKHGMAATGETVFRQWPVARERSSVSGPLI